ncbi:DUF1203 domain-containing protein [Streptomyces sp. RKAG337]|uniref:DUF1203 domain-containing protein n=1 Tax=Streptomyces sp. RKAG337 TaxID=2893404 RepID=UPI0020349008|nr:DUF1203 domain-containing protein [Streptomyces sp. RKAG337]MCM2428828.1 DUF1203 domain-containing protein [Streptomyces sp. RKAG337]
MTITHETTAFRTSAIDPALLARLRDTDDAGRAPELSTHEEGGAPLRCCLRHAAPGDRIALLSYAPLRHWAAETGANPGPYLEMGPVFVHADADACPGPPSGDGYPLPMHGTDRVFRAYSADGRILGGRLVRLSHDEAAAGAADAELAAMFSDPEVALVHVRAVEFGCFLFAARRAG